MLHLSIYSVIEKHWVLLQLSRDILDTLYGYSNLEYTLWSIKNTQRIISMPLVLHRVPELL